jgi:hypothetical protein
MAMMRLLGRRLAVCESRLLPWTLTSILVLVIGGCSSDANMKPDASDGGGKDAAGDGTTPDGPPGDGSPSEHPAVDGLPDDGSPPDGSPPDTQMDGGPKDVGADLSGPPPAMLTATVSDRRGAVFELLWTAPSNNGQAVKGYQIRYAKVPITAANFDDTAVTKAIPYTNTPAQPGATDGTTVKLYIENAYYFAVIGTDVGGAQVGTLMTTTTAVAAHFNVSLLSSPAGTNQQFGAVLDGSADLNGDGISDLLVAAVNDGHAYLYLGAANFAPTAPAVTFSGSNPSFGGDIRAIGDIDKDGLPDVAVSDQTSVRVLIFKGRRTWPATLADTEADYTITTDTTWASSAFGFSMAALGDFNGDGTDDFVIGAPAFNTRVGRIAVVYGQSGFTSFGLPSTTRALEVGGDPALNRTQFGLSTVGLGHFYTATSGTTLVVSAPGLGDATSTSSNEGRIYAFHGRGPGASIDATAADHVRVGPGKGALIGQVLTNLGPVVGTLPSIASGNTSDKLSVSGSNGSAFVLSGTVAGGPLMDSLIMYQPAGAAVGQVLVGGGFSGRDGAVSIIGDAKPDIGLLSQTGVTSIDIIDGSKVGALASPLNTQTLADVHVPLPAGWSGAASSGSNLLRDVNGDGIADFAVGDVFGTVPGRVAVFW